MWFMICISLVIAFLDSFCLVNSKVNAMLNEGWEIISINSGVEAFSGKEDANGIFITRYYFKKPTL